MRKRLMQSARIAEELSRCCFFCNSWCQNSGEDHLEEALNRGAKVIISESSEIDLPAGITKVKVEDAERH